VDVEVDVDVEVELPVPLETPTTPFASDSRRFLCKLAPKRWSTKVPNVPAIQAGGAVARRREDAFGGHG